MKTYQHSFILKLLVSYAYGTLNFDKVAVGSNTVEIGTLNKSEDYLSRTSFLNCGVPSVYLAMPYLEIPNGLPQNQQVLRDKQLIQTFESYFPNTDDLIMNLLLEM